MNEILKANSICFASHDCRADFAAMNLLTYSNGILKEQESSLHLYTDTKYIAAFVHDIRSPLAVINIILHTICNSISCEDYSILKEAMKNIHDIINNTLCYYKASNFHESQISSIDLGTIVENIIKQKKIEWQNNPCEITFKISSKAKYARIRAREIDLKRIISNLLNNSYDALCEIRRISIELKCNNNQLMLCIEDQGIGISKENIQKVMEGASFKKNGNGIGLSEAKRFMENRGDNLTISSKVGKGTVVTLAFMAHINV